MSTGYGPYVIEEQMARVGKKRKTNQYFFVTLKIINSKRDELQMMRKFIDLNDSSCLIS